MRLAGRSVLATGRPETSMTAGLSMSPSPARPERSCGRQGPPRVLHFNVLVAGPLVGNTARLVTYSPRQLNLPRPRPGGTLPSRKGRLENRRVGVDPRAADEGAGLGVALPGSLH